jgi:hypothetical protein
MRINGQAHFQWQEINKRIRAELGCQSKVFVFASFHQALFEVCMGLHLRFPHKKKIVAEMGLGDHFRFTEVELARHGVRTRPQLDLAAIDEEQKQILAYVHDMDDALTAEMYDHLDNLKAIAATKIVRVHLAHHLMQERSSFVNKLSDLDIVIAALDYNLALVFTGEKLSFPLLGTSQMSWCKDRDMDSILKRLRPPCPTFEKSILSFESQLPEGVEPWFPDPKHKRLFDRSLIYLPDHDGSAMVDLLLENLNLSSATPGEHCLLESASYARWQNEQWFERVEEQGRDWNQLRGMVMIHGSLLTKDFAEVFKKSLSQLKELSQ